MSDFNLKDLSIEMLKSFLLLTEVQLDMILETLRRIKNVTHKPGSRLGITFGDGVCNLSWTAQERLERVEQRHNQGDYLIDKLTNHLSATLRCSILASQAKGSSFIRERNLEKFSQLYSMPIKHESKGFL